jgi:hypothetical protein
LVLLRSVLEKDLGVFSGSDCSYRDKKVVRCLCAFSCATSPSQLIDIHYKVLCYYQPINKCTSNFVSYLFWHTEAPGLNPCATTMNISTLLAKQPCFVLCFTVASRRNKNKSERLFANDNNVKNWDAQCRFEQQQKGHEPYELPLFYCA